MDPREHAARRDRAQARRLPATLGAVLLLVAAGLASDAGAQLRNVRYCEVIAVYQRDGELEADVWNSLSAGDPCLPEKFAALDAEAIRQELGAFAVALNGLRFWQLDFVTTPAAPGELRTFGGIAMRLSATVKPSAAAGTPYTANSVRRDTQFLFRAGREVYELVDPDGRVHIMQSYSQAVDGALTEADLAGLGARLMLPDGWRFRARVLDADHVVEDQAGIATVVTDELENTYQYFGFQEHPPGRRLRVRRTRSGSQRLGVVARDAAILPHAPCEVDGDLVIESRGAAAPPRRIPLAPDGWRPLRSSHPERGCRYDGGPVVQKLRLRAGRLRLSAQANDLGVPLGGDPTPVRVRLRHGERNYCFTFGGTVRHRAGRRLVARGAPALEACPSTPLLP